MTTSVVRDRNTIATLGATIAFAALAACLGPEDPPPAGAAAGVPQALAPNPVAPADRRPVDWVDPFIGTGGHGHTFPGATTPFGMVQLSPDTRLEGWDGCSGYHDADRLVYGFSHTHLSGTGVSDYGDVLFAPTVGSPRFSNGADGKTPGYRSAFRKETENASPGYYRVRLDTWRVIAELTATTRAGFHRYAFPKTDQARILIDLTHRDEVIDSGFEIVSDHEIRGFRRSKAWALDQHVYFVARFSKPFTAVLAANDKGFAGTRASGRHLKASLRFDATDGAPLLAKVGISAVDVAGAAKNLDAEIPTWDFDGVRRRAREAWNEQLDKIEVAHGTPDERTIFYTALYHCCIAPNTYSDVDGRYRGMDLEVRRADGFTYYTVFSLWDTFRTLHPLLTLIEPDRTRDFVRTLLADYRDGGALPIWALAGTYTGCMIGYHAVPVIADAYAKGIRGFDEKLALEAMVHSADLDRRGLESYKRIGYIPADVEPESVSKTLEYAYDDWCIAEMARHLGRHPAQADLVGRFGARAQNWKNLYDPSTGFFRAKVNQAWFSPFDPAEVNFNYTEANAWQYRFFVPHHVEDLAAMLGGDEAMKRALDALFTAPAATTGRKQADITGLIGQYAHGNEPSHHMAYLYAFVGAPHETQRRVRQIMHELYRAAPDGLCGNEDCGQMSAWYVMSALGFYPVVPGSTEYVLGSPVFTQAHIHFPNKKKFTVTANAIFDCSPYGENDPRSGDAPYYVYVAGARLNGRAHAGLAIDHAQIVAGGELELTMSHQPGGKWAAKAKRPSSASRARPIVPVPFVARGPRAFQERTQIALGCAEANAAIHYRVKGSRKFERYSAPFEVTDTTTIEFYAERPATRSGRPAGAGRAPRSARVTATFRKIDHDRTITLGTRYENQYAAGGDEALIDGIFGGGDFRTGTWQGYHGVDLDVTIDLGESREVERLGCGFLQDQRAWIWMPLEVEFAISDDGATYRVLGKVNNTTDPRAATTVRQRFALDVPGAPRARFVRIRAKNREVCPAWHPGAGRRAWIFADEVTVQ